MTAPRQSHCPNEPRPPRRWQCRLAALTAGIALSLGAAELLLREFGGVSIVGPSFTRYDPRYGKTLKRNLHCRRRTPEFSMSFSTNSSGWRGPEVRGFGPRVVFLGDSFTMGYGVDDGEEFPQLVARALGDRFGLEVNAVNMGLGDSGNGRWLGLLEREVPSHDPALVVLQLCKNDFSDNLRERLYVIDGESGLRARPPAPPGLARRAQALVEWIPGISSSYLYAYVRQSLGRRRGSSPARPPAPHPGVELTMRLLGEALERCAEGDWPALVITIGFPPEHTAPIDELCRGSGATHLALPGKSERPDLYYETDGHWRAAGHLDAAERIELRAVGIPMIEAKLLGEG